MNLVPRGMVGEIYIGGVGVARGYLGRPELTAQRFVPDPFSCQAGAVLYKTGDLARYRADGAIEFLGREDHQVKIRGFRIELGEIAEALRQYPGVREVALAVLNDKADQKYLVAYIVPQPACELTPDALRSMLRQRLPAYMVPSLFLLLDALPRFPNGKIDYSKLTALDIGSEQNREVALPRNEVEEMLLDIWREVLALEYVGIHDPFLDLGGHSLQALRILLRVQETFRITMSYAAFLQHPTLAEQATYILEHKRSTPVQQQPEPTMQRYTTYGDVFPLSFGQQQLWLIDQLGSQSLAYNVPIEFHLRGALDLTVFRRCLQEIVDRHEVLRTTIFPDANGRPVQAIKPAIQIDLPLIDLRALTDNARKQEMHHLTRQAARISFDLTQGPLLHTRLVQLADDEHVLLLTMHHIMVDDWSLEICQQELAQLYQDFVHGRAPSLAALPIRYADFALWQHKWLDSAHAGQQFAYWRQQLSDPPDMVRLPTDHSRPAQPTFQGAREDSVLPDLLTQQLKQLSHHEGVTLYILLLCAFKIFLYRYTGQCDIIVGSASAGRQYPEVAHLLGFFANMLALRTQLSPDLTFLDALQRVHETVLEANAHQEIPFGQLVERLQPRRNLGSTPLFEVTFALQHASKPVSMGPDLLLEMNENDSDQVQFAVEVLFVEREGELSCSFKYATELYEAVAIRRMMQNFQCLLESIVAQPQHHLSDLPLLAEIERKQVLFAWNATHSPLSEPHCLHDLFEQQVARTPEAIAVTSGDQQLSYQELNERANQLAHSLRTLGCAPEVPVGLYLERSLYLMIGVLGVLKAGGAYLPLDPTYPRERLAWILADAQVPILLTQTTLLSHLPEHNSTVVCLDDMMARYNQSGLTGTSTTNPLPLTTDMHLAYIIYTSGSTGQPKGVLVTHRSVVNHSLAIAKQYARVCQVLCVRSSKIIEGTFPRMRRKSSLMLLSSQISA
jgi:non-ribosomal peptide synthetase component F/acyl carrier protein